MYSSSNDGSSWQNDAEVVLKRSLGDNYTMNSEDFARSGFYQVDSLASSGNNAPASNAGDYKIISASNGSATYPVLLAMSPRPGTSPIADLYTGKFWAGAWQGWNRVTLENDVVSSDLTLTNATKGVTIYSTARIKKNAFMVLGTIVLHLNNNFVKNSWHTLFEISPAPLEATDFVGETDGGTENAAILQFVKARVSANGKFGVVFTEDVSSPCFLYVNIGYFYK